MRLQTTIKSDFDLKDQFPKRRYGKGSGGETWIAKKGRTVELDGKGEMGEGGGEEDRG